MKLPQSFTTVTTLSKILALILFVTLPFIGFYLGYKYRSILIVNNTPIATITPTTFKSSQDLIPSSTPSLIDERSCFAGVVPNTFKEDFFIGKTFENFSMSGEWGTLASDHRLLIEWGLDWAGPNDTRANTGIGGWSIENDNNEFKLNLSRTSISDGTYSDFKFYKHKQNIFAVPVEYTGIIWGPSKTAIENFFDNVVKPCWKL